MDSKYFGDINSYKSTRGLQFNESISYIDKLFLIKQLLKFRILLYLFLFSQMYFYIKGFFLYQLNANFGQPETLQLFNKDSEIVFSSYFDREKEFFSLFEICEYFFRVVFCFIVPIYIVLLIVKKEVKYFKEQQLLQESNQGMTKQEEVKAERIKGIDLRYRTFLKKDQSGF